MTEESKADSAQLENVLSSQDTVTALFAGPPGIKVPSLEKADKIKYNINNLDHVVIHNNLFDSSFVEYFLDSDRDHFDIIFDQKLYDAPKIIVDTEKRLADEAVKAKAAEKNKS